MYAATQMISNDPAFLTFKKFVNSLRCPLCQSQLDGNIHPKEARLYCVRDNAEYTSRWAPEDIADNSPRSEVIRHRYSVYEYIILITKYPSSEFRTQISRYNVGASLAHRELTRKELFDFMGNRLLLFRSSLEEDVLLKKLKIYNLIS